MPPNLKGGKNYKKNAKKGGDNETVTIDWLPGQQVARVIKLLGNRNMSCYCNDNTIRICRVRGKMRGRDYVEKGDIVLISLREFEEGALTSHDELPGDILAKYPYDSLSDLKKNKEVNPKLFMQLEVMDDKRLLALKDSALPTEEDGFEFDRNEIVEKKDDDDDFNVDDI